MTEKEARDLIHIFLDEIIKNGKIYEFKKDPIKIAKQKGLIKEKVKPNIVYYADGYDFPMPCYFCECDEDYVLYEKDNFCGKCGKEIDWSDFYD